MTAFFKTQDNLRLAYDDVGMGHPILCLPGLTRNMADFEPILERFGDEARILRLDSRGRGLSDRAADVMTYSLPQEAEDVRAFIDYLGLRRVTILGTSRGGLIAMILAVGTPELLAGTILNDIGPVIETGGMGAIMDYIGRRPAYRSYDEAADRLPEAMAPRFANVPRDTWRRYAERLWIETEDGLDLRYDPGLRDALLAQAAQGPMPDLWPLFDALALKPVTLLRGANSDLLSAETAAAMQARAPRLDLVEVPDRGHVPFLDEQPAIDAIARYLEQIL